MPFIAPVWLDLRGFRPQGKSLFMDSGSVGRPAQVQEQQGEDFNERPLAACRPYARLPIQSLHLQKPGNIPVGPSFVWPLPEKCRVRV